MMIVTFFQTNKPYGDVSVLMWYSVGNGQLYFYNMIQTRALSSSVCYRSQIERSSEIQAIIYCLRKKLTLNINLV